VTIDAQRNKITYHQSAVEPWRITLVDTGEATLIGGRLKRVAMYLTPDDPFCFTYGDGLADIAASIKFHLGHGRKATLTAVVPPGRYGALVLNGARVTQFVEKPPGDQGFINGGFFVLDCSYQSSI
jgi:glucose-1-phosphate cytidylyltransferase